MNRLLAAGHLAASLFTSADTPPERIARLKDYFQPAIGSMVHLHPDQLANIHHRQDQLGARGFITVTPPAGRCLVIKRADHLDDSVVCKKTQLAFSLRELQYNGNVRWLVYTGKGDDGTEVSWPTPYRLLQYVRAGQMHKESIPDFVLKCQATDKPERKVEIETLGGAKYTIRFPRYDTLMIQPPEQNLFVKDQSADTDDIFAKSKEPPPATPEEPTEGESDKPQDQVAREAEARLAREQQLKEETAAIRQKVLDEENEDEFVPTGKTGSDDIFSSLAKKSHLKRVYHWNITKRQAFKMEAINFISHGSPQTKRGSCRYRYQGGPFDKATGAVECVFTEAFDAVIVPLTCTTHWLPRRDPHAKTFEELAREALKEKDLEAVKGKTPAPASAPEAPKPH